MFCSPVKRKKQEIIDIGRRLYDMRLVAGSSGNLSARLDRDTILVTATGASLGDLRYKDIIKVSLENPRDKRVTSEFPLHSFIYKNFPHKAVIHCHPVLINGYFAVYSDIKPLTFETKLYLGNVPLVPQDTPAVTKPELVIEAMQTSNLVALKNHGVVAAGATFKDALHLIETLEDAVKVASVARLFKKEILDDLDKELKEDLIAAKIYPMFSQEHIQAIVDLVNKDEFMQKKGEDLDLTVQLAIKLDGSPNAFKFTFEKGKIIRLDAGENAPFVISGPASAWEQVFLGKLDSFVAVTQGKMKLTGEIAQLARWYVPFSRLFELFKQVKIK